MEVPQNYKNAALCNLIGGGLNVVFSLIALVSTLCFGIWFAVAAAAAGYQAYVGWQMMNGQPLATGKTAAIVGIVGSLLGWNPISLVASIGALVLVGNDDVKGYLQSHGVTP